MASSGWNLKHISYSMLSTWLTCREKFRQKYVLRNKEPDGIYFPQGNTIHAALYDFHQTPGLDEQLLYDMAQDYWANEIEGKEFYDFKGNRLTAEQVEEARIDTMRWLGGYVASVKAGDTPFISFATPPEQDVECNVDGSGFTLRGYIDFFPKDVTVMDTGETLMDCKDGYMHIGDFKTGSKKFNAWTQTKADIDLQPTVYGYIMGKKPVAFHYMVIEKTATHEKPSIKHIITYRDEKDYEMLERIVHEFERSADRLNQYEDGKFFPEPVMGFGRFCSKLCSFKDVCWETNFSKQSGE